MLQTISSLEKDIAGLKKEIGERDETIGDKEKRIYDLKKKNQASYCCTCLCVWGCIMSGFFFSHSGSFVSQSDVCLLTHASLVLNTSR